MTSKTIILKGKTVVILIIATFLMHRSTLGTNDFGTTILVKSTVVILINATTSKHKSTLSKNDFENNHFGQKYSSDFK